MVPSVLALALCAPAASATAADVRFGVLGGVSFATIDFDPEPEAIELERITGPAGGVTAEFALADNFAIDARALWVRKGAEFAPGESDAGARIRIDYVAVPVLFKLRGGGSIRPYVGVGPEVGFKVDAKTVISLGDEEEEEDISDDVKSTDFSLAGVAGLEVAAGSMSVFLEAGYSHGLSTIAEEANDTDAKNRTWLLVAGLRF